MGGGCGCSFGGGDGSEANTNCLIHGKFVLVTIRCNVADLITVKECMTGID
jgi:hypothetical protein